MDFEYNSMLQYQTWVLVPHHWISQLLGVNGYIKIYIKLMGHSINIKLGQWFKVSLKLKGLTMMTFSPMV